MSLSFRLRPRAKTRSGEDLVPLDCFIQPLIHPSIHPSAPTQPSLPTVSHHSILHPLEVGQLSAHARITYLRDIPLNNLVRPDNRLHRRTLSFLPSLGQQDALPAQSVDACYIHIQKIATDTFHFTSQEGTQALGLPHTPREPDMSKGGNIKVVVRCRPLNSRGNGLGYAGATGMN